MEEVTLGILNKIRIEGSGDVGNETNVLVISKVFELNVAPPLGIEEIGAKILRRFGSEVGGILDALADGLLELLESETLGLGLLRDERLAQEIFGPGAARVVVQVVVHLDPAVGWGYGAALFEHIVGDETDFGEDDLPLDPGLGRLQKLLEGPLRFHIRL